MDSAPREAFPGERWVAVAVLVLVGVVMLVVSWGRWPDVLIDFGRELYVPWQLTQGKRLYADLAYLFGPLSPSLNALWFRMFGVSLRTLVWCNLALLSLVVALLYRLLQLVGNRASAVLACVVFLTVFAFAHLVGIGNYNFICPYAHELTHGLLLSLTAILLLARYQQTHARWTLAAAGLTVGLVFLTKPEVFTAAALALITGLTVTLWVEQTPFPTAVRRWGLMLGGVVLPPLLAWGWFSLQMPMATALGGTLGGWRWALRSTPRPRAARSPRRSTRTSTGVPSTATRRSRTSSSAAASSTDGPTMSLAKPHTTWPRTRSSAGSRAAWRRDRGPWATGLS